MTNSSVFPGLTMVSVVEAEIVGPHRLRIAFSDGSSGERDFSEVLLRGGAKVAPLRDPAYFARAFVEDGVLTWPNGYDWDPLALHGDMAAQGALRRRLAAE